MYSQCWAGSRMGLGSRGHPVTLLWSRAETFTWSAFPSILTAKTAMK